MPRKSIPNKYIDIDESTMGIVLHRNGKETVCLFDKEDFPRIKNFKWSLTSITKRNRTHYVITRPWRYGDTENWFILMHQFILSFPSEGVIDHINHKGFDNRKSNLRVVTKYENARNKVYERVSKSGFKGVQFKSKQTKRPWAAEVRHLGKLYRIGDFKTPEEAARAYDNEAIKLRGFFAQVNFPESFL